jgi:formylglycine-generating enzyme required for sulfatase activity
MYSLHQAKSFTTAACFVAFATFATAQQAPPSALERLQGLQAQFDQRVNTDVEVPYNKGVGELNVKYTQALNQVFQNAQNAGNLEEAVKTKDELQRITKNDPLPKEDDPESPPNFKRVRTAYRQSLDLLATKRDESLKTLQGVYAAELQKIVIELTKQGKLEDALAVTQRIKALPVQAASATVPPAAVTTPAPIPTDTTAAMAITDPVLSRATKDQPYVNSLGMKFVPVEGTEVLFCIHETRLRDYRIFAAETQGLSARWNSPLTNVLALPEPSDDYPAAGVPWKDAKSFCDWLSKKEGRAYRLPSDQEWSRAVGVWREERWRKDTTPDTVTHAEDIFPWGRKWPLPAGAGNFSDQSSKTKLGHPADQKYLESYDDGFHMTSPVMSYQPNELGIYDLAGNVIEWCEDFSPVKKGYLVRGSGWRETERNFMLSSARRCMPDNADYNYVGFRVVLVGSKK